MRRDLPANAWTHPPLFPPSRVVSARAVPHLGFLSVETEHRHKTRVGVDLVVCDSKCDAHIPDPSPTRASSPAGG